MLCEETFLGAMQCIYLLTTDQEPMTDQGTDSTKVQVDGPISFIELLTGIYIGAGVWENLITKI